MNSEIVLLVGDMLVPQRIYDISEKFKTLLTPNKINHILCLGNMGSNESYEWLKTLSNNFHCVKDDYDFDEPDYDSMVNNGDNICLNCTYWSVSPYGAAHGMVCRKGYSPYGPDDSCSEFVQQHNFANYGDSGQYQFDETGRAISNKLNHWRNNR